jgi:hypothetical protein
MEAHRLYENAKALLANILIEYGIYKDAKRVKEVCEE